MRVHLHSPFHQGLGQLLDVASPHLIEPQFPDDGKDVLPNPVFGCGPVLLYPFVLDVILNPRREKVGDCTTDRTLLLPFIASSDSVLLTRTSFNQCLGITTFPPETVFLTKIFHIPISINILYAIPPTRIANIISKNVMNNALFHPCSLTKAAMVEIHGI